MPVYTFGLGNSPMSLFRFLKHCTCARTLRGHLANGRSQVALVILADVSQQRRMPASTAQPIACSSFPRLALFSAHLADERVWVWQTRFALSSVKHLMSPCPRVGDSIREAFAARPLWPHFKKGVLHVVCPRPCFDVESKLEALILSSASTIPTSRNEPSLSSLQAFLGSEAGSRVVLCVVLCVVRTWHRSDVGV